MLLNCLQLTHGKEIYLGQRKNTESIVIATYGKRGEEYETGCCRALLTDNAERNMKPPISYTSKHDRNAQLPRARKITDADVRHCWE